MFLIVEERWGQGPGTSVSDGVSVVLKEEVILILKQYGRIEKLHGPSHN